MGKLPISTKKRHTLANCKECALQYLQLQSTFPGGHVYESQTTVTEAVEELIVDNATSITSEQCTTRQILLTLQPLYEKKYGHSFMESLIVNVVKWEFGKKQLKQNESD